MFESTGTARSPNTKSPVGFVSLVSIVALVLAAVRICVITLDMIDRLAHRGTGIILTWDPGLPLPQPENVEYSGAPYILPGSTPYISSMTGMVKDVGVNTIVLQSLGDMVEVLTTAGIVVCILIVARKIAAGTPFAPASVKTLVALAIIVFIGFQGATLLHGLSELSITSVLFVSPQRPDGVHSSPGTNIVLFAYWPVYISAVLMALAAVFRAGGRYQSDSSGLV